MVLITIELVRKRAEHNDGELAPLEEIALHQEDIEKIEHIQNWCPKLQILLLQSNLISKIENLHKLKSLQYLNLALNNIEKIENLNRCESLEKLDFTLNFIGELTSIENLKNNYNLKILYLTGNPCTDYDDYRNYVIATLPQLEMLDSVEIKRSERILALQKIDEIEKKILKFQKQYIVKRIQQKEHLTKKYEYDAKLYKECENEEERNKRFWNEKTEHSPEVRVAIAKQNQLKKNMKNRDIHKKIEKPRTLFAADGRAYNINEPKLKFTLDEDNQNYTKLELQLYKYLDTSLLDVDIQPFYVRVKVKEKIFQICLNDEIIIEKSSAQRSQMTGYLLLTMRKLNGNFIQEENVIEKKKENKTEEKKRQTNEMKYNSNRGNQVREYLEIGSSQVLDLTDIWGKKKVKAKNPDTTAKLCPTPSKDFIDDLSVPPLI